LAKSLEDEDALVRQINQNIETVKSAVKVMDEIKREEQKLKKLKRDIVSARGTLHERKYLLQQNGSLEILVEKARMISAWEKVSIIYLYIFNIVLLTKYHLSCKL
jgi:VIT1/CCC1 family predicted Fe2+/Mn2+ transporter